MGLAQTGLALGSVSRFLNGILTAALWNVPPYNPKITVQRPQAESAAGGPLAVVQDGDEILFDGPNRKLQLLISQQELDTRLENWKRTRPKQPPARGYYWLYVEHVMQADRGCDLDFLTGASGSVVERESH